jgi:hypothetical protein
MSGGSSSSSHSTETSSKDSTNRTVAPPSGLSVVKISFPETGKGSKKSQKTFVAKNN